MNLKKSLFFALPIIFLTGCTPDIPSENEENLPDLTNLYAQVCENVNGPCISMMCQLEADTYICAESISDRTKACSQEKTLDDIINKYKICGDEKIETLSIYSYGETLESVTLAETPAELQQKIEQETEKVESGGTSDFLSTMLAVAGGSIIGGMISNALFGQNNAMPPARASTVNEQPFKKEDLDKSKEATKENNEKVKQANSQTKTKAKASSNKKKSSNSQKKSTNTKKKSSSKRRR
jgi:hypothetical protein